MIYVLPWLLFFLWVGYLFARWAILDWIARDNEATEQVRDRLRYYKNHIHQANISASGMTSAIRRRTNGPA